MNSGNRREIHMEIERKFTIKSLPDNLQQYECKVIEQGYLSTKPVLRIRKSNDDYILTYKSKFGIQPTDSEVIINNEVELPLDQSSYEHLKEKIDGTLLRKKRYLIPLEDGLKVELDVFENQLQGLCFAEIEFPSQEEAERFELLDWFDQDVSQDSRYGNGFLSKLNSLEEFYEAGKN